jgi:hypothetical protein
MLFLLAEIVVVGSVILGLYALKDRLGLGLILALVAANQFLQHLLAVTVHVDVQGRYPISPGSAVLLSSGLFAVLVLYFNEDVPTARRLVSSLRRSPEDMRQGDMR